MSDNGYKIIGKDFSGIEISHMVIENSEGKTKKVPMYDIIKLARGNKLSNAEAIFDSVHGEYILHTENELNSIINIDRTAGINITLTARIIDNGKCIGYKAVDSNSKAYKLSIEKVWELAEKGSIKGVKAKVVNNKKVLLSHDDFKLSSLPKIDG